MRSAPIPALLLRAAPPVAAECVVAGDLAAGILFKPQDGTNWLAQNAGSHMARQIRNRVWPEHRTLIEIKRGGMSNLSERRACFPDAGVGIRTLTRYDTRRTEECGGILSLTAKCPLS